MSEQPRSQSPDGEERPDEGQGERPQTPGLEESLREVGGAGRETIDSARRTARTLRRLVSVDLALARSAFGRGLAWAGVAMIFGGSAWLLLTGAVIALLERLGFSWFQAMFLTAMVSLLVAGIAAWRVVYFFEHTGLHATRRQLRRMGLFDEPGDDDDEEDL